MTEPSSEESLDLRFSCLRSSNDFSFSNPLPPTYFRHEPSPCPLGDPGDEMLSLNVVNELAKVTFGQYVGYARKWTSFSLPQTSIPGSLARAPGSTHAAGPPSERSEGTLRGPLRGAGSTPRPPRTREAVPTLPEGEAGSPGGRHGLGLPKTTLKGTRRQASVGPQVSRAAFPGGTDDGRGRRREPARTPSSRLSAHGSLRRPPPGTRTGGRRGTFRSAPFLEPGTGAGSFVFAC